MKLSNINPKSEVDISKMVHEIFQEGIKLGASDVHLEPTIKGFIVRYRVDGVLKVEFEGDKSLYGFVMSKIKILAELETTGLPRPLEGNIKFNFEKQDVDLRISIFPTSLGEVVVARVLESKNSFGNYGRTNACQRIISR